MISHVPFLPPPSSTLPITQSALGSPAPWHSVAGKTQPVYRCLWTHVQPFHSVYFFHSVLCLVCHKERKGGKAGVILAQHLSAPTWKRGGNPQRVVYLVLTSMNPRTLHKAFSLWKQRDLGWNLSQLFWGMPRASTGREWRKREIERTVGSRVRMQMSSVEFLSVGSLLFLEHNCLVFCLQFFFPRGPQRFHFYLENSFFPNTR